MLFTLVTVQYVKIELQKKKLFSRLYCDALFKNIFTYETAKQQLPWDKNVCAPKKTNIRNIHKQLLTRDLKGCG